MNGPGRRPPQRGRGPSGPPRRPLTTRPPEVDLPRQVALELLAAVREEGAYANLTLPKLLVRAGLSGRDAGLATEIAYGTCRMVGQLDTIIENVLGERALDDVDPSVLDALRIGAYQLLHTRIPSHAAVSVTVDLVRAGDRPSAAGFVNAILRKVSARDLAGWIEEIGPSLDEDRIAHLAFATSHPRWITTALAEALDNPDELPEALAADDRPAGVHLVARPGLLERDELAELTEGEPGRWSPYAVYLPSGDPARFAVIRDGRAAVQDEGSQLMAVALATADLDGPDLAWLDLAAGPGGKAALLGALADQRGAHLDAIEPAPHRADLVRRATAGLPVTVHVADGRDTGLEPGSFDRVLLDAPCTGLGALRRRPESRWRRQSSDVDELAQLQRELLTSAAELVRPGGLVGYVTCSPHLAETAGVIAQRPENLELVDARPYLPGVPDLGDGPTVQLWPHRQGTDGMFLALLRRT